MKKEHKARLQAHYTFLVDNLEPDPLLDLCFQGGALTTVDMERLRAEKCRPSKVELFLDILLCKEDEDRSYQVFRKALEAPEMLPNQGRFLAQKLDLTELPEDVIEDTRQKAEIKQILGDLLVVREERRCPKTALMRVLRHQLRCRKRRLVVCEQDVLCLVSDVFPDVEFRRNKKGNVCTMIGIHLKEMAQGTVPTSDSDEASSSSILEDVSEERVAAVMKTQLDRLGLDVTLADKLEEEEIDGEALKLLDGERLKMLYPMLKMGKIMKIMECVKRTLEELCKQPSPSVPDSTPPISPRKLETYRAFDTQPKRSDVYEKGHVLPNESLRPGGNLLEPLHKYRIISTCDPAALAKETVTFAAACMNERVNGTIHFGVRGRQDCGPKEIAGEIVGMQVNETQYNLAVTDEIYSSFFPDQVDVALACIREVVCIPILHKDDADRCLSVVEVDVVPRTELVTDKTFYLKPHQDRNARPKLFRYMQGNATEIEGKDLSDFLDYKKTLYELRKESETSFQKSMYRKHLHNKLHHLLTGGYKYADIYPVVFLSPCSDEMTDEYLLENFRCLKSVDPIAVFDFDPLNDGLHSHPTGLYTMMERQLSQVHKTLTTDNFDENSEENKNSTGNTFGKLHDDICNSSLRTWIFCNGYGPLGKREFQPAEWIRKRALGFKEALRFYEKQIPKENARILIFVLSSCCDVLLPALEEVFAKFPDQWILIAENEKAVQTLVSELRRRAYVDKEALEERSVTGMPWSHVNQSIMSIFGYSSGNGCKLVSSSGSTVLLKERKKNEWSDLEILSTNQCSDERDDLLKKGDDDDLRAKNRQTEEEYYRGAQVSWWNFLFKKHVLEREQVKELQEMAEDYLSGNNIPKNERVGVVNLFHQPGAGATTIARQVLWNLKSKYRCCVVKQITDQTSDHIANLRGFEEEQQSALPPIVLVDNEDIDKICQLRSQLNEKARRLARGGKAVHNVFCVLIVCRRITHRFSKGRAIPYQDKACVMLDHELKPEDIQWFQDKYKELEARHKEKQGLNPKLLFSFNILKENFNPAYMQRMVGEFVSEIHDYKEKRLLRFVALINSFDIFFQTIPVSCFNAIMCPPQDQRKDRPELGKKVFSRGEIHWASKLSQSLNVLLNRTSKPFYGKDIKAIRIVNNNLSKKILETLIQLEEESVSDVILDLLQSDIFKRSNESCVQSQLGKLVRDVLKTRRTTGKGREKFSPLILRIGEKEDYMQAAKVLEAGFEVFEDPMLAQQIARVYIHIQEYEQAERFARIAIDMEPANFYLFDTLGQIYKQKLLGMWDYVVKSRETLEGDRAKEILDVAFTALDIFRGEQSLSDQAVNLDYTNCGLMFQLHVISTLIDICRFLQPFKRNSQLLHKFLVDMTFVPDELKSVLGEDNVHKLKMLYSESQTPLKRLEDEEIQLKDDPAYQESTSFMRNAENYHMLSKIKIRLLAIFGENTDDIPKKLSPEDACEYRRRVVMRKGGTSLLSIRKLREERDARKKFESMYDMIHANVSTDFCTAEDLRSLLNLTIARLSVDRNCVQLLSVSDAMNWALHLYDKAMSFQQPNVEACLFLVMLHWPTDWRRQNNLPLCPCSKVKNCIERWKGAFRENHPAQKRKRPDRHKPTTLFFLGKGQGFDEIVFYSEFEHLQSTDGEGIWDKGEVKCRLKQLRGTLHYGGKSVSVKLPSADDGGTRLEICTSLPITDKSMWNRTVSFVLGFSWSGPKAYDVNQDVSEEEDQDPPQPVPAPARTSEAGIQRVTHEDMMAQETRFWQQHNSILDELEKIKTRRRAMSTNEEAAERLEEAEEKQKKRLRDLLEKRRNVLQASD
ncbi:sterile alpha motif domain-containing protein 9-like [Babylonia areolata]|uniref:sterile alpha motif domain-containing protein 9-like n=1 Tax=Babylonia areolata TaxID=304850 RepID=UPI003FD154F7